jgi:hypothetical protein
MLEIIRVIAETIPESLSIESPLKARKGNGREDVGTDLYLLYSALNNILVTGRNIVWELEHSLDWLDRKATEGEPDRMLVTEIGFKFQQQIINILQFLGSLKRLGHPLQVVSSEFFLKLAPLIFGKFNLSGFILYAMGKARLFSVSRDKLRALMDLAATAASEYGLTQSPDDAEHFAFMFECKHRDLILSLIEDEGVENLRCIPAKQNTIVRQYLAQHDPKRDFDAIEAIANYLRDIIAEHFSLSDILLSVGDERCSLWEPYVDFGIGDLN